MKIYTRTGDAGTTSLVGGRRLPKNHVRIEAYGTVDELTSHIGLLLALAGDAVDDDTRDTLRDIQTRLFSVGAYLATDDNDPDRPGHKRIIEVADLGSRATARLEADIDRLDDTLPTLSSFILPGGHPAAAQAHVARTVARRAERRILSLADTARVDPAVIAYVNRLSDYLFTVARSINARTSTPDTPVIL